MADSPSVTSTPDDPSAPKEPNSESYEPSAPPEEPDKPLVDTFMPKLYTFKVSDQESSPETERSCSPSRFTRMPPFWTLLDHSLGVIWCLVADKHVRTLGISDLQWTLQFLKGVRNKQGEYPKDVQALIDTIQDQLIEQYASMTTQIPDKQHDEESSDKTILDLSRILQTPSTPHLDESIYHDATDELPHVSTPIRKTAPFTFDTLEPSPIRKTGYAKSPMGTDTSVTYAELMEHWPANSSTSDQPKPTEPCPKHETKTDSTTAKDKGPVVPEEEMVRFLMEWHDERINKIKEELSSLHNIEKFITNIDPTARPKTLDGQPFKKT